ncbi:MAG: inorganic phosphate transporter [Candidatus Nezhaarchaeota archaeon]|nr:inorganic phosphate transporter [Candidatus Nezhaarchaeota archaeon]
MIEIALYIAGLMASAFMAFCIGANDAANPVDQAVGAGTLALRRALFLFSLFAMIGALVQGRCVIKTLGAGIIPKIDVVAALVAVVAAGAWVLVATLLGLPISTSQSITGAVVGVGLAYVLTGQLGLDEINWSVMVRILLSWITSPTVAISLALLFYLSFVRFKKFLKARGYDVEKPFLVLHVVAVAFAAYAFGANDVANATGVYLAVTREYLGLPTEEAMLMLSALGGTFIAIGGFTLGYRVIRTTAFRVTRLDRPSGAAAGLSLALTVWLFTTIPYMVWGFGMPISTTHVSVSSIMGVGIARAKSLRGLNFKVVAAIIVSWLLTVPITMGIASCLYLIVQAVT